MPTIVITKLPDYRAIQNEEIAYLHLKITNPKDFKMKISITSNSSTGSRIGCDSKSGDDYPKQSPFKLENGSRYDPFSLESRRLQLITPEVISLNVGAFEDELLRDDDDDGDGDLVSVNSNDSTGPKLLSEEGWSCTVSHNVAHLILGLKIFPIWDEGVISSNKESDLIAIREKISNSCFLPLTIATEYGEELKENSFQSIVAFPHTES